MEKADIIQLAEQIKLSICSNADLNIIVELISEVSSKEIIQLIEAYFCVTGQSLETELRNTYKQPELFILLYDKDNLVLELARKLLQDQKYQEFEMLLSVLEENEIETLLERYFNKYSINLRNTDELSITSKLLLHMIKYENIDLKQTLLEIKTELAQKNKQYFQYIIATTKAEELQELEATYNKLNEQTLAESLLVLGEDVHDFYISQVSKAKIVSKIISNSDSEMIYYILTLMREEKKSIKQELISQAIKMELKNTYYDSAIEAILSD